MTTVGKLSIDDLSSGSLDIVLRNAGEGAPPNPLMVSKGQVTFDAEGNDNLNSPYFSRRLHFPGGASGPTIGRGYDMGGRTSDQVQTDLVNAGMSPDVASQYAQGATLHGDKANQFVQDNRNVLPEMSREVQQKLFETVSYPKYETGAEAEYQRAIKNQPNAPQWSDLDNKIKTVAVDFKYQQGQIYNSQMQEIIKNDPNSLANSILNDPRTSQYDKGRGRANYLRNH
ncbi:MAG TPA: pesticin C-terminus-like muramidase [Saprospiraceae bacterium]|nr:pesticin C-terminus-like muramidase [Saprospiraceae bacterium]